MEREELIKRFNIDIEKLEREQLKLAKGLEIKDKIDFSLIEKFGAVHNIFIKNKILSGIIVCDKNFEILEQAYAFEKTSFPYLAEFRAYRELPAMMNAFAKLNEKPDLFFIQALGITHPRLGLASHFSLTTGVPVIGITDNVFGCEIKNSDILRNNKKIGKVFTSKPGSRPLYISPGNQVSIETSLRLTKDTIILPHKLPEPLHLAHKYVKEVKRELGV